MRKEDAFRPLMRGDLELWGVDKVDGSMATLAGQIRCTDTGRWAVQREFNRRMKMRLQEEGIEIASPGSQTVIMQLPPPAKEEAAGEGEAVDSKQEKRRA
jgi:moderate conductance mechanosensitive channel